MVVLQMIIDTIRGHRPRTLELRLLRHRFTPIVVILGHIMARARPGHVSGSGNTAATTTGHDTTGAALIAITEFEIGQHGVVAGHGVVGAESGLAFADDDIERDCSDEGDGRNGGEREEGLVDAADRDAC